MGATNIRFLGVLQKPLLNCGRTVGLYVCIYETLYGSSTDQIMTLGIDPQIKLTLNIKINILTFLFWMDTGFQILTRSFLKFNIRCWLKIKLIHTFFNVALCCYYYCCCCCLMLILTRIPKTRTHFRVVCICVSTTC